MKDTDTRSRGAARFWPFGAQAALLSVPGVLVVLVVAILVLRSAFKWPGPGSDALLLTGVLVLSLLPLGLSLLDVLASRGGSLEYAGLKIDFAAVIKSAPSVTLAPNIGVPGVPVPDSASASILDTLRTAVANDIVVVDLGDGRAWWETRLLVLSSGGARLGRPQVIVFVATEHEASNRFVGWSTPIRLATMLLRADARSRESYNAALAATRQWELIPPIPGGGLPPTPASAQGLAQTNPWIAYDGLEPNELAMEQYLAADFGSKLEPPARGGITLSRLNELFAPVLHTETIDERWAPDRRLGAFLASDSPYVALVDRGGYVGLLSRTAGLSAILDVITRT